MDDIIKKLKYLASIDPQTRFCRECADIVIALEALAGSVESPQRSEGEKQNGDTSGTADLGGGANLYERQAVIAECINVAWNAASRSTYSITEGSVSVAEVVAADTRRHIVDALSALLATGTAAKPGVQDELTQMSAQRSDGIKET